MALPTRTCSRWRAFAREPFATAGDVAEALGVPVGVAPLLVADLQAAGMIEPAPVQKSPIRAAQPSRSATAA
jgi:hypothetical protein